MTAEKGANPKGRSLAHRVAARALGLDASETEGRESGGISLRNPFSRDRGENEEDEADIIANCHIGVGSNFRGTLMVEGTLLVDGEFEGDILNCDRIIVGPYGHVRADVHVREAIVAGVFDGGIQAEERAILLSGARVRGDLTSHSVVIEDGVRFSGRCTMLDEADERSEVASTAAATRSPGLASSRSDGLRG
jgi:cytoskeletal protein CcmA (bactofilin family)